MLFRAAREHNYDLAEAIMIGDDDIDVMAGKSAGTAAILLRSGGEDAVDADVVVDDLVTAVELILSAKKSPLVRRGTQRR